VVAALASEFVASSMRRNLTLLVLTVGLGLSGLALAQTAEQHEQSSQAAQTAAADKDAAGREEEHGLPNQAIEIARPFGFAITNSMAVSWAVALGLIIFAQVATRNMKRIPSGAQNFWEWMVEGFQIFSRASSVRIL
jgi:F-type H+-transporting ATPase subunit a